MGTDTLYHRSVSGMITVEAAIILVFTLGVIFFGLYMGFALYDREVISSGAYEAAVEIADAKRMGASDSEAQREGAIEEKKTRRLFYKAMEGSQKITMVNDIVSFASDRSLGEVIPGKLLQIDWGISEQISMSCIHQKPETLIRMKRHWKELGETES